MASTPIRAKESGYVPGFEEDVFISWQALAPRGGNA